MTCAGRDFGRHASEAPRPETPCHVGSGTVVSRNATRPCQKNKRRPSRSVARPWQPRHRERCHACSRAWPQIQKMGCAPVVGEGRNTMLRRGRFASPMSESVHGRLGLLMVIEEQSERYHHGGEELLAPSRAISINRTTTETRMVFRLFRLLRLLRLAAILPSAKRGANP